MSGKVAEDELFDLPARGRPTRQIKKMRKIPSFDRASLDRTIYIKNLKKNNSKNTCCKKKYIR